MSTLPSSSALGSLAFVVLCLLVAGAALTAGGTATQADSDNGTEVTHNLTIGLSNVPADDASRTLYVTVPDSLAGTVSVDSLEARGAVIEPTNARVVDGPDADGQRETVAVDVRASGGGTASGTVGVTVVATYPDLTAEEAESIVVGGVSGSVEYTVDDSDPLFQRALESTNASVSTLAGAESILAVTPPELVVVDSLSVGVTTDSGLSLSVPLDRLTGTPRVAVDPASITFENGTTSRDVVLESAGDAPLTVGTVAVAGNDSAFRVSGVPDRIAPGESNVLTVEHVGDGGGSATLRIPTDAANTPTPTVDLSATARNETDDSDDSDETDDSDDEAPKTIGPDGMEVSERSGERTVNVTVRNLSAGDSVSISMPDNVTPPGDGQADAVAVENMSMTAAIDGDFNLSLSTGRNVTESVPEMNTSDKQPLGFLSIDHSWDNDNISEASMTVRVEKSRVDALEDTDPDEVALYRYLDGAWKEERTQYLGERNGFYRYQVFTTGYSDWATAGKQPDFRIVETGLNVSTDVEVDDVVKVTVSIENDGGADGDYLTELWLNDVVVDSREVSLAPGGSGRVVFERQLRQVGTYEVRVNNVTVDQIEVESPDGAETTTGNTDGGGTRTQDSGDDDGLPMVLIAGGLLLVGIVGGGVYYKTNGSGPSENR